MASESTSFIVHSEVGTTDDPLEPGSDRALMTKPIPPLALVESAPPAGIV